jgi:hypothetical protein
MCNIKNIPEYSCLLDISSMMLILILSDWNLKFLCGAIKCLSLPMHIRGLSPNGIYVYFGRLRLLFSMKLSGSNFSVSGKYIASKWIPNTGI